MGSFETPSPLGDCVIIRFFVAAHMGENRLLNSKDLRKLKLVATTSKHDCDTPSCGRGQGRGGYDITLVPPTAGTQSYRLKVIN